MGSSSALPAVQETGQSVHSHSFTAAIIVVQASDNVLAFKHGPADGNTRLKALVKLLELLEASAMATMDRARRDGSEEVVIKTEEEEVRMGGILMIDEGK
jgi:hypothetical protein